MSSSFKLSNKRLRDAQRFVHLVGALFLVLYVYAPWESSPQYTLFVRVGVIPALVATGLGLWQLPRLRQRLARRGVVPSRIEQRQA